MHHQHIKKYHTGGQKRSLSYIPPIEKQDKQVPLQLPQKYIKIISDKQYKKIKSVYFMMATVDYKLESLGIIIKNKVAAERFMSRKERGNEKDISWEAFLEIYYQFRSFKGSYKQVQTAVNKLDKQYKGHWQILLKDLTELGDVLTERQLQIFEKQIIGDKVITNQTLINAMLGYK